MKRNALLVLAAAALVAGLGWYFRPRAAQVLTAASPPAAPEAALPPAPPPPPPAETARLSGRVVRKGVPAPGVRVVAKADHGGAQAVSGPEGSFTLPGLEAGQYWVSAATESEASAVAGPFGLGTGEVRGDVVLELLAAGSVRGTVYDAASRETLSGVKVESSAGAVITDRAGRFFLRGLPVGETWVEASGPGHLARTEWLTLDAARELGGMEIFLQPAGLLEGRVTRIGKGVSGALVWAEPASVGAGQRTLGPATSAANGRYQLPVEAGTWRLAAAVASGARVAGPTLTLGQGESKSGLDLELGEGLEVYGVVRINGVAAAGATLYLLDGKTQRVATSTASQGGGHFAFSGLSPGSYLVQVQRGALNAQRGPFNLEESGQEWAVDVDGARALTGTVTPARAGVSVRWRSSDWAGPVAAEALTDARGAFAFDGVPDGALWVEAQGEGGSAREKGRAGTPVHLELVPSLLKGTVLDDAGHAVNDFTVRLAPVEGGALRSYPLLTASGDFQIQVPPGQYEVSAVAVGYGDTAAHPRVEVRAGETFVKLTLQASAELYGRVVDGQNHQPVVGAEVVVFRSPFGSGRWASLKSGADGTFRLSAAPHNGSLQVTHDGYQPSWVPLERVKRAEDGHPIDVPLNPGKDDGQLGKPYEGIGLQLDFRGAVRVASVFEGGPAEAAGVLVNDVILAADGQPLAGRSGQEVISKIMGPAGSVVRLSLQRGDQTLDVQVRRQAIQF